MTTSTDVNTVDWMFAVNASTTAVEPDFDVQDVKSAHGNGVWAMTVDSRGCLWFGGDLTQGSKLAAGGYQWLGSFGKVCGRDTTPPSQPTKAALNGRTLSWTASTDNLQAKPSYEVLQNDRVIATTTSTSYVTPGAGTYFVRAIDATGNRSASTAGVTEA